MNFLRAYLLVLFCGARYSALFAAACVSTGNGNWYDGSTWSCGAVPACGDSVVIQAGHTVSITADNYNTCGLNMVLVIRGTLQFTSIGKLQFSCSGRVLIPAGGKIIAAPGATGQDNSMIQCGSAWWHASAGTYNGPGCMPPFLAGCGAALPVEIVDLTAKTCLENAICIEWSTATEHNHNYFELERSENGEEFSSFQKVYSNTGYSRAFKHYSVTDLNPFVGNTYYRLRQVDRNGDVKNFPLLVKRYTGPAEPEFTIFPNPSDGNFTIKTTGLAKNEQFSFQITDPTGRLKLDTILSRTENSNDIRVSTTLPEGMYFCAFTIKGQRQSIQRLIVLHN